MSYITLALCDKTKEFMEKGYLPVQDEKFGNPILCFVSNQHLLHDLQHCRQPALRTGVNH